MIKYTSFKAIPQFTRAGSYAVDIPLDRVPKWVANEQEDPGLVLTPEFQRGHVWTKKQQVAYLEFLLRGGRTGRDLYFNYPSQHVQGLTAIQRFFGNELKVFGSYFREYTDTIRMTTNTVRIHVNDLQTEKEVLNWYLEMNAGGTPHSKTELARVKALLENIDKAEI